MRNLSWLLGASEGGGQGEKEAALKPAQSRLPEPGPLAPLLHQLKMTHRRRKEPTKPGYREGEAETEAEATGRGADSWGFHILSS